MYQATKGFRDKETGKAYYAGDPYDGNRGDELVGLGYLEKVKTDLTVKDIKSKLDELGIEYDSGAKKSELLELLGD